MVRVSFVALFATALVGFSQANVLAQQEVLANGGTVHTTEGWSWDDCGLPGDPIQIKSIQVSPDPPKPGSDLTVTVNAVAQEVVENGAYVDVTVKLGLIKLLSKQFDLCDEAEKANATVQCPVDKGEYTVVQTAKLPKEIPQAKFTVLANAYTVGEDPMFCVNLKVDFMKKWPGRLW